MESVSTLRLPIELREYLDIEAKRLTEERGKRVTAMAIIVELVRSYREKRIAKLITNPED